MSLDVETDVDLKDGKDGSVSVVTNQRLTLELIISILLPNNERKGYYKKGMRFYAICVVVFIDMHLSFAINR